MTTSPRSFLGSLPVGDEAEEAGGGKAAGATAAPPATPDARQGLDLHSNSRAWLVVFYDEKGDVIRSDYNWAWNAVDAVRESIRFTNPQERSNVRRIEVCERTDRNERQVPYG